MGNGTELWLGGADMKLVSWASDGRLGAHALPVTSDWPLASLQAALCTAVLYLVTIGVFAKYMRSQYGDKEPPRAVGLSVREKFAREPVLVLQALYNPVQVALCAWMIYEALRQHRRRDMTLFCNEFSPKETGMARVLWVFYLSKVLDFFDTVFIVARRKWRQLSFLHLYHHTSIFLVYWLNLNAGYDGDIYFTIVLNGAIHLIMYAYYGFRTFNVSVPTAIKMLITKSQMIQFVCMNVQAAVLLCGKCAFPRNLTWMYLFYIFTMLYLFNDFSAKTYRKGQKKSGETKKAKAA